MNDSVLNEAPMQDSRILPIIHFDELSLPQVGTWDVGGKYYVVVGLEMVGKNEAKPNIDPNASESQKNMIEGRFQVTSVQELPPQESNKMERKAFEGAIAKARSGGV